MPKHIKVTLDFTPVEKGMPKDGTYCFVLEYGRWHGMAVLDGDEWFGNDMDGDRVVSEDVTHWAPIPNNQQN